MPGDVIEQIWLHIEIQSVWKNPDCRFSRQLGQPVVFDHISQFPLDDTPEKHLTMSSSENHNVSSNANKCHDYFDCLYNYWTCAFNEVASKPPEIAIHI